MATETTPLRKPADRRQRFVLLLASMQRHYTAMLAFMQKHWVAVVVPLFCVTVVAIQLYSQTTLLPPYLKEIPTNDGIRIIKLGSEVTKNIIEWSWVFITNDLDKLFHDRLFGIELTKKEKDALRKVKCLVEALRILITDMLNISGSLVQACGRVAGILVALVICAGVIGANVLLMVLGRQHKAVDDNWVKSVDRNNAHNMHNKPAYDKSQRELCLSRIRRASSDMMRKSIWLGLTDLISSLVRGDLTPAVYSKILGDVLSLNRYTDKLLKDSVPAWTLLRTCLQQPGEDIRENGSGDLDRVYRTVEIQWVLERGLQLGQGCTLQVEVKVNEAVREAMDSIRQEIEQGGASFGYAVGAPDIAEAGGAGRHCAASQTV